MALYEIEENGSKYEIEAADEHTAMAAFRSIGSQPEPAQNAPPPTPAPASFDPAAHDATLGPIFAPGQTPTLSGSPTNPSGTQLPVVAQGGASTAFQRGAGQGVTFGGADELAGVAAAATGGSFDRAVDESRAANKAAREAHPWAYGAGQLVGGVAGAAPAMIGAPAFFGLRGGMALAPRIYAGARSGAALGGVQGVLEGEGGLAERGWSAGHVAGTGAVIGTAAPFVGAMIGAGGRAIASQFSPSLPGVSRGAAAEAVNAFEQAGPATVRLRAAELGPQAMVLDLGQPFLGRAQGIAAMPGEAGERIVSGLQTRNAGTNARLANEVEGAFGPAVPAADVEAQFQAIRNRAGPLYEQATTQAPPIDTTGALSVIGQRLNTAEGAERAGLQRALDLLMPARGPDSSRLVQTDARNLHSAKRALDDLVTYGDPTIGIPRGAFSPADSAVFAVRRELNSALEAQVPGYAAANQMTATAHRASEALESGKRVLDAGETAIHPDLFARDFAGRPIEQQAALRQGVRSDLDRIVGTKANDLVAMRQQVMADGDWNRAKLAQVFGPDEADRVFRAVDRETAFRDAYNRIYQGSQTAQRTAGASAMDVRSVRPTAGDMSVPISTAAAGPAGGAMAAGLNVARRGVNALGRDADLVRNRQVADILLRSGPELDATVVQLSDALARRQGRQALASNADRIAQVLLSTEGRQEPVTAKAKMLARVLQGAR